MSTWSEQRIEEYRQALKEQRTPEAVLRIPAVKLVVPVFEGTSDQNLNRGAGRIEGTARTCYPFSYVGSAPKRFIVHAEIATRVAKNGREVFH